MSALTMRLETQRDNALAAAEEMTKRAEDRDLSVTEQTMLEQT